MLKITSGEFKGRQLTAPKTIRPTEGVVRQALFNILRQFMPGTRVLDGFAGSGALGIEALSNGADHTTFVDCSIDSVLALRKNLESLQPELERSRWRVMQLSFCDALRQLERLHQAFDLVILDPPYNTDELQNALNCLGGCAILAPGAILAVEHHRSANLDVPEQMILAKQHRYGATVLSLFQQNSGVDPE